MRAWFCIPTALLLLATPARASEVPLVYDNGVRSLCFQHIGQTRKAILAKRKLEVSNFRATECADLESRPKKCRSGNLWRNGRFLADGTCPAWFVQTFNWTSSDRGRNVGWDFHAEAKTPGEPYLMTIENNAADDNEACTHREVNFNYNFPGMSFVQTDGRPTRLSDYDDVKFRFRARLVEATAPACAKRPRALVKLSIVLRWYKQVPNTGERKSIWQSSIAVLLFDGGKMFASSADEDGIVFNNKCTVHGIYKNNACMVSLAGNAIAQPVLTGTMQDYSFSITELVNQYRSHITPEYNGEILKLEDAEFKSVQIISAVNGANVTFELQRPELVGVAR